MSPLQLDWWVYLSMVLCFFVTCLGLNYIVKKINEAKIDERFIRMLQKASTTQSTQVNGPSIALETSGDRLNSSKTPQRSPLGISLVFNREENRRRTNSKKLEVFSLNNLSQEKINVIPMPSKRNVNDSISIKTNESKANTAKHTSSQKLNEINKKDSAVTEVVSVKKSEFVPVQEMVALPVNRKDCAKSELVELVSENKRVLTPKETPPLLHIGHVSQDVTITGNVVSKKAEVTTSKEIDCITEYIPIKNIYSSLLITKQSFLEIAMKKSKLSYDITQSSEKIDTGISIKTSADNIANKQEREREYPLNVKSATDIIIRRTDAIESSSKKKDEINKTEYIPLKRSKSPSLPKLVPKRSIPMISLKDSNTQDFDIFTKSIEDMRSENLIKKTEDRIVKGMNDDSEKDQPLTVKAEKIFIFPVPNEDRDIPVINKPSSSANK